MRNASVFCIFLYACLLAQASHPASPAIPACDQWGTDSVADSATFNLTLRNAPSLSLADKRHLIQDIKSHVHLCGNLKEQLEEIAERVRQAYQERGYFKAFIADPEVNVIGQVEKKKPLEVVISVNEGQQYRLGDISFTGQKAFTAGELRKLIPIQNGDIFNTSKIHAGLENLRGLYGSYGYVNFTPVPDTKIDDHDNRISIVMDIDEGALFRYGKLTVNGDESVPGARATLLEAWKHYQGLPYDSGNALKRLLEQIHAQPNVKPEEVFEISWDQKSHVVNVCLTLLDPPEEMKDLLKQQDGIRARSSATHH